MKKYIRSLTLLLLSNFFEINKIRKVILAAILRADADDIIFNGEAKLIRFSKNFEIKRFIDVGANVGNWSKEVVKEVKDYTEITMFEPNENYNTLLFEFTRSAPKIKLNPYAISPLNGQVGFIKNGVFSHIDDLSGYKVRSINADFIGNEFDKNQRYLIKIDVEGFDLDVLAEFVKSGICINSIIQIEYGEAQKNKGITINDYIECLPNHDCYVISGRKLYTKEIFMLYDFCIPLMNVALIPKFFKYDHDKF